MTVNNVYTSFSGGKKGRWHRRVRCSNILESKGTAFVRLEDGSLRKAEIHWYEAHGVGRRGLKIKRILD